MIVSFCKIINGELPSWKVWENEQAIAILNLDPITACHTLVLPKEHYENIFEILVIEEVIAATQRVCLLCHEKHPKRSLLNNNGRQTMRFPCIFISSSLPSVCLIIEASRTHEPVS